MPPHHLTNFEIQKYYQNESRFNGVYSRDNLQKINLDEYSNIRTYWIPLYTQNDDVTYVDSYGSEYIPKEIITFICNKNIKTNIFRIQACDSIICGYFWIILD